MSIPYYISLGTGDSDLSPVLLHEADFMESPRKAYLGIYLHFTIMGYNQLYGVLINTDALVNLKM